MKRTSPKSKTKTRPAAKAAKVPAPKGGAGAAGVQKKAGGVSTPSHRLYRQVEPHSRRNATWLPAAKDSQQDVTSYTHGRIMSFGRLIYTNVSYVGGAIDEMASHAVGSAWQPQSLASDADWAAEAEERIGRWLPVCDFRGAGWDWQTNLYLSVVAALRDGDTLMVLTATEGGYPKLQFIPAHRLTSRGNTVVPSGNKFSGMRCYCGVIFDRFGRIAGYQVSTDADDGSQDLFIGARSAHLIFSPYWSDQGRGISALHRVIHDVVDVDDIESWEKMAGKLYAMTAFIEKVTESDGDEILDDVDAGEGGVSTEDGAVVQDEETEGGLTRRFLANSGTDIKAFEAGRPSPNLMAFRKELLRGSFVSLRWPMEYALDPGSLSGSGNRVILGKVMRTTGHLQAMLVKAATRAITFATARFIEIGMLPFNKEWYRWGFQLPKKASIDDGRNSQQQREDFKLGLITLQEIYGERGLDWMSEIDQRILEAKYVLRQCKKARVPVHYVMMLSQNEAAAYMAQTAKAGTDTETAEAAANTEEKKK